MSKCSTTTPLPRASCVPPKQDKTGILRRDYIVNLLAYKYKA
ncbi:uncharacterized protein PITG_10130 [Phytophthora infestans T30-4]|uniref:Uncharacterized protein n=1 Tax=Phytophthora infestans (strain T30-4) TaxID=403677 RepID=D0NED8_PHYIT|nr:uncharacterized protein PITG_10130 [Phytophthora infestans T30-4]EEY56583.1 hypothetical protein PITG_10130 [Phytophthora infestans T30-4]|eukprot:XP_002902657.1 hypothetical protein PITG_10130 [Phytophthora infestans T30-4]